jgi:hypothetical protein
MEKYITAVSVFIFLIVFFLIDKAFSGLLFPFNYFSLTLVFLLLLVNIKANRTYLPQFFIFGLLADWYNRVLLGPGALVAIIGLYLFYALKIRFYGHKVWMTILNFAFSFLLTWIFLGFGNVLNLETLLMSLISMVLVSILWLRN